MIMENSKISVIIPVYKVEAYLPRCLDSVINQTYKNLEIILVDDGSPDKSGEICDKYAALDGRIKVIHKSNEGVAKARNDALDVATGDYIGFVDSDDWIEPDMYEFMANILVKNDADISMCGHNIYENGEKNDRVSNAEITILNQIEFKKRVVVGGEFGLIWNKLFKKTVINTIRFDVQYDCSEDLLFVYHLSNTVNKVALSYISKYNYCRRLGGLTTREPSNSSFYIVEIMKFMLEQEKNSSLYPFCVKGYVTAAYIVLSGIITSGFGTDRYDELRNELLSHKKEILFNGYHTTKDKMKIILLYISKHLYNHVIKKIRKF